MSGKKVKQKPLKLSLGCVVIQVMNDNYNARPTTTRIPDPL